VGLALIDRTDRSDARSTGHGNAVAMGCEFPSSIVGVETQRDKAHVQARHAIRPKGRIAWQACSVKAKKTTYWQTEQLDG